MRIRTPVVAAVCATLALAAAGCGSDDKAKPSSSTTTTSTSSTTTTVPATTVAPTTTPTTAAPPSTAAPTDDRSRIIAVVSAFQASQGAPAGSFQVTDVQISSIDPQWGAATVAPPSNNPTGFQPDRALVRNFGGNGWMWIAEGTSGVGCESGIPDNVRNELDVPGGC